MRYLISIKYDGSKFYGFQRLNNENTVQKSIEGALTKINKAPVEIKGAGRTDKGVHALDQKASFDLNIKIDAAHLKEALNSLVKPYIYIKDVCIIDDNFHARFNVKRKTYLYKINLGEFNPLYEDYMFYPDYKIDIKKMKKCRKVFLGAHNFENFVAGTRTNYECIIYNIKFKKKKDILEIKFIGKSFYRYMVRNLVGAMLDVARKKASIEELKYALDHPEIKKEFLCAPPKGLYLEKIEY